MPSSIRSQKRVKSDSSFVYSSIPLNHTSGLMHPFTYVGVVGLSFASVLGVFRFWKSWEVATRSWTDGAESAQSIREADFSELRRSLFATQEAVEMKEAKLDSLEKELDRTKCALLDVEKQLANAKCHERALGDRVEDIWDENQRLVVENKHIKHDLASTHELQDVQFAAKASQISDIKVTGMLKALNTDIMQTAAILAKAFKFHKKRGTPQTSNTKALRQETEEMKEASARVEEIVGPRMVELLKSSEHYEDPIVLQIAFQASMAAYAHWIISSWYFEDPQDEHMLNELYARIRETEEQTVSGRWRSLTRKYVQHMVSPILDLSIYVVDSVVNVLITAGTNIEPSALHDQVGKYFAEKINRIIIEAKQVNKTIGEGIISCDLEALYIAPDVTFNSLTMLAAYGQKEVEGQLKEDGILCTTELGLVRAEKKPGLVGEWDEAVLYKPKVIMQSGIECASHSEAVIVLGVPYPTLAEVPENIFSD